jgi:dihydroorotate dehydrogenase
LTLYTFLRPLLFALDAETAHNVSLASLDYAKPLLKLSHVPDNAHKLMGMTLRNPIGLAAGLDKNGEHADALAAVGFGFVEVGTVTPKAQAGNPLPRIFRLSADEALINRLGFNNLGVERMARNLERRQDFSYKLGVNIGKNKDTPNESAVNDYLICLERLYAFADYFTVNISSPNTPGLRDLQGQKNRRALMQSLADRRQSLATLHGRWLPMALKIAPDMDNDEFAQIVDDVHDCGFQAVIGTNTTNTRTGLRSTQLAVETGGLSGRPLTARSREICKLLSDAAADKIDVISVGGIHNSAEVNQRMTLGASAVQVYSALIYEGPWWVRRLVRELNYAR